MSPGVQAGSGRPPEATQPDVFVRCPHVAAGMLVCVLVAANVGTWVVGANVAGGWASVVVGCREVAGGCSSVAVEGKAGVTTRAVAEALTSAS
jgi:hypothetical protein